MKKHVLFVIAFCLLSSASAIAQWYWQKPYPTGNDLDDILMIDANEGWAAGYFGTVLHTTDGGMSWEQQYNGNTNRLWGIYFLDGQTGWTCGAGTTMLHTSDGGQSWNAQSIPVVVTLRDGLGIP